MKLTCVTAMSAMEENLIAAGLAIGYVLFWLVATELLGRKEILAKPDARKVLHIVLGNIVLFLPLFVDKWVAFLVPVLFIPANFLMTPYSPIKQLRLDTFEAGHALGTVYYPISLAVITWFGFDHPWLLVVSFFPLAYGDGLAAVTGVRAKDGHIQAIGGQKSLLGSWTFVWATFLSIIGGLSVFLVFGVIDYTFEFVLLAASLAVLVGVTVEFFSPKGLDNLLIPLITLPTFFFLEPYLVEAALNIDLFHFSVGLLVATLLMVLGWGGKALTIDGGLGGCFMGILIMALGGWTLGIALLLFFVVGTLVTKVGKKRKGDVTFEKGSTKRDSMQAMAKAGFASIVAILMLFTNDSPIVMVIVVATMGTSLADTVGTEIGTMSKSTPRPILAPWRVAKKGESGAVSAVGTLAALVAALLYTIVLYVFALFDPSMVNELPVEALVVVPVAALLGMFADSIIGVTLQEQRRCEVCGSKVEVKEHCDQVTTKVSGFRFFHNDLVNFSATTLGGLIAGVIGLLLWGF